MLEKEDALGTHNLRFTPWITIVVVFYATIKMSSIAPLVPEARLVHKGLGAFHPLARLAHFFFPLGKVPDSPRLVRGECVLKIARISRCFSAGSKIKKNKTGVERFFF